MPAYRIAVIAGDGIGTEVIEAAMQAVNAVTSVENATIDWNELPWSSENYLKTGYMVPEDGWETLQQHDAIFLGALGSPKVPDTISVNQLLLPLRRKFDLYVNLRPAYLFEGVDSPLKDKAPGSIDLVCYRENTEGEYAPVGGKIYEGGDEEIAVQNAVYTRRGCHRIMRAAFEAARKRPRKKVTSITKSNALIYGMTLWDRVFTEVAKDYPDVESNSLLVDAAAMDLVRRPENFDVITCSNLFGDILTDLSAMVTGSVGLAASGNINPERKYPSMFEPVHGSAPDIAGKSVANPMAAMLSACMMLDHLQLEKCSQKLHDAVATVLKAGNCLTPDLGGKAGTREVTQAVLDAIGS